MKNKIKVSILILFSIFLFSGCMTNENISKDFTAGSVGCKPEKIQIVGMNVGLVLLGGFMLLAIGNDISRLF